jgi:hypothetical protein
LRKNIFDIVTNSITLADEVNRIVSMSVKEKNLYYSPYNLSVFEFVDKYCFKDWNYRGHFVDLKDFLEALEYNNIIILAQNGDVDAFMTLIELTYNLWLLAYKDLKNDKTESKWQNNFYHLRDVMLDNLEKYNYTVYIDDDRALVIEDRPEVTATVETVNQELALEIIRYNHSSLKGEIELKKKILLSLGSELEPKRKELQLLDKQLSEDIFFMLNNLNIRHNNRSKKDKSKYKEYVANMSKTRLEKWYDELYQMMLLAFLLLDNIERKKKVSELKSKIIGG